MYTHPLSRCSRIGNCLSYSSVHTRTYTYTGTHNLPPQKSDLCVGPSRTLECGTRGTPVPSCTPTPGANHVTACQRDPSAAPRRLELEGLLRTSWSPKRFQETPEPSPSGLEGDRCFSCLQRSLTAFLGLAGSFFDDEDPPHPPKRPFSSTNLPRLMRSCLSDPTPPSTLNRPRTTREEPLPTIPLSGTC